MIFSSKKTECTKNGREVPLWSFDTENAVVIHYDKEKEEQECTPIFSECILNHVDYTMSHCPERFQKLVDDGKILEYLENLDERVFRFVNKLMDFWKQTDNEYIIAKSRDDNLAQARLLNMFEMRAKEIVYNDIIYA